MGALLSKDLVIRRPAIVEKSKYYTLLIETGNDEHSGCNGTPVMIIYGSKATCEEFEIKGEFKRGTTTKVKVPLNDIGEIWMIKMWNRGQVKHPWQLNKLKIQEGTIEWTFPIYQWIWDDAREFRTGIASLPHYDKSMDVIIQRSDALERLKALYQWNQSVGGDFPSVLKAKYEHMPREQHFSSGKAEDFITARSRIAKDLIIDKLFEAFSSKWSSFEDYQDLFRIVKVPESHKVWRTDEHFGELRFYGASCNYVKKVNGPLPSKFGVTNDAIRSFIGKSRTLDGEIARGKIFLLDFEILDGLPTQKGRYLCAPLCLLHLNEDGRLLPIAIQLHQRYDKDTNPIWTPSDTEADWLFAKMWVAAADLNIYQITSHWTRTHLVMETIAVAINRNFSQVHPLFKLMHPHLKFHLAINAIAREGLITPTGILVEAGPLTYESLVSLIRISYKGWTWDQNAFPKMCAERGFSPDGKDAPPNYFYIHDGLLLWNAIHDFVRDIVNTYYIDDSDAIKDAELQGFATDAYIAYGPSKKFPNRISTRSEIIEIFTSVIFQVSVQHAVLNFTQYETFAYLPATPGCLFTPPPGMSPDKQTRITVKRGVLQIKDIFNALPTKAVAARQLAVLYLLSQYSSEDQMLGNYPEEFFTEEKPKIAMKNFKNRLDEITTMIKTRCPLNEKGERSGWPNMLPERIPNSTAI